MKKIIQYIIAISILTTYSLKSQVAISMDGGNADESAMLDVESVTKGLLLPRMTQSQIEAISNPANGLVVYNLGDNRFYLFDELANEWKEIAIGVGTITPTPTTPEVLNPTTGETWMDRNLGASQVATSSTDALAYGDLYQWGRDTDGHESRTSPTTSVIATTAVPNAGNVWDGKFITHSGGTFDWLSPQDNTLWQGVGGTNNPCPSGFRIPTNGELNSERLSWSSNNAAGAFASPLKLTLGGYRGVSGGLGGVNVYGYYRSSTIGGGWAYHLVYHSSNAWQYNNYRVYGFSVRCIKD